MSTRKNLMQLVVLEAHKRNRSMRAECARQPDTAHEEENHGAAPNGTLRQNMTESRESLESAMALLLRGRTIAHRYSAAVGR